VQDARASDCFQDINDSVTHGSRWIGKSRIQGQTGARKMLLARYGLRIAESGNCRVLGIAECLELQNDVSSNGNEVAQRFANPS
jgi:hypothetical protein